MTESDSQSDAQTSAVPAEQGRDAESQRTGWWKLIVVLLLVGGVAAIPIMRWRESAIEENFAADAQAAARNRDWRSLEAIATEWTRVAPENGTAWLRLAGAQSELGKSEAAAESLARVPHSDPRAPAALVEKAAIEWEDLNDPQAGLESCRAAIELNPKTIEANTRIIGFYAMTFQRVPMLDAIRNSIRNRGEPRESYIYLMMADQPIFTNAVELNQRWLASDPDSEVFRCGLAIQTALHLFIDATATAKDDAYRKEQEALQRLDEFSEAYPSNTSVLSVLLDYYAEAGDHEKVRTLLARVPKQDVRDHIVWMARGWYLASQGKHEQAKASLETALKLHPMSQRAIHEMASVLRSLGELDEAARMQGLAARGTAIRKKVRQLDTARHADAELLLQIAEYCRDCGDPDIADALTERLEQIPGLNLPDSAGERS